MKKVASLLAVLSALALVLSACHKEDPETPVPAPSPKPAMELKLSSFSFKAENNSRVHADAIGIIQDNDIRVNLPGLEDLRMLIPTFSGTYSRIYCNGKALVSGTTAVDFSDKVEIRLYDEGNNSVTYNVIVNSRNLLPVVTIDTEAEITSRTETVNGTYSVTNCQEFGSVQGSGRFRGRGNATFLSYPKKAYKMKLDEQTSILGLHANKDWVLLAEYCDRSLLRNTYQFEMSTAAGMEWVPKYGHVDLYLNGSYNGMYLLTEQVERAKSKVQMEDDGFFIEHDNYYSWESLYFKTTRYGAHYTFKYPNPDNGNIAKNDASYNYILGFMNEMEAVLDGADFKDPEKGYRKYLDAESFAKWYLVMEIMGNHDPNFYYVLPTRGAKLKMYPTWDAEWTLGVASAGTNGWQTYPQTPMYTETSEMYRTRRYFKRLFKDSYFVELVYSEWQKMKPRIPAARANVEAETARISYGTTANFDRWKILGVNGLSVCLVAFPTWKQEVDYASSWLDKRIAWFDGYISDLYAKSKQ